MNPLANRPAHDQADLLVPQPDVRPFTPPCTSLSKKCRESVLSSNQKQIYHGYLGLIRQKKKNVCEG